MASFLFDRDWKKHRLSKRNVSDACFRHRHLFGRVCAVVSDDSLVTGNLVSDHLENANHCHQSQKGVGDVHYEQAAS
jgi:hypothetical protein